MKVKRGLAVLVGMGLGPLQLRHSTPKPNHLRT
jgi:hypothetical protein